MGWTSRSRIRGYTLVEVLLAVGLLALISAMVVPAFMRQIQGEELPGSARQFRSLLWLMRANAALEGKRYRLRFPREDEKGPLGDNRQPLIEREDDPILEPEVFNLVTTSWAVASPLLGKVWCSEVRLGKPDVEQLRAARTAIAEELENNPDDFEPEYPPLDVEVEGTTEWATFVLTEAPRRTERDRVDEFPTLEVILDGVTGLAWVQRPLLEEEIDLFEEKGWPVVLGQDYTDPLPITEDRVLELREFRVTP